jgi:trk system potassium uptake protein TrkH
VLLVLGFGGLIAVGTLALLLPVSARGGRADPLTALFTATSAVCVTGLVVVDTGTYWSPFGQAVILALLELGGLGFTIGVTALALLVRGRLSLRQRVIIQETGALVRLGGQGGLIRRTIFFTLACEALGALLLWADFWPRFGPGRGLWLATFHAVSAFTNGSFDLFGEFRSLADFRRDPLVLLTTGALIAAGGLSLVVVEELRETRRWRRLSLDSKAVLLGGAALFLGGTAIVWLAERGNPASLAGLPPWAQVLNAAFHATAARTAGFATWDFAQSDQRSLFFLLGPMFVGGAPGSMAGGIKVTTAVVLLAAVWSALRGRPETTLLGRRIVPRQVALALAVATLALALIANVALAISLIEGERLRAPFLHLVFETTSAFGTVGFSTGVAPRLSAPSKLLLTLTMFVGRLGPVTVALALTARRAEAPYRLPSEAVRIG